MQPHEVPVRSGLLLALWEGNRRWLVPRALPMVEHVQMLKPAGGEGRLIYSAMTCLLLQMNEADEPSRGARLCAVVLGVMEMIGEM